MGQIRRALLNGRAVALPRARVIESMKNQGVDPVILEEMDCEWVTVYPDDGVEPGITEDADMPAIGELLRETKEVN